MKTQQWIIGLAFLTGCAVTGLFAVGLSRYAVAKSADDSSARPVRSASRSGASHEGTDTIGQRPLDSRRTPVAPEVLAVANTTAQSNALSEVPSERPMNERESIDAACDLLDERMLTAPMDRRSAGEMERAIGMMVDASVIPKHLVRSSYCGSTICKIVLGSDNPNDLEPAVIALSEKTPKLFSGAVVFSSGNGDKMLYLAKDSSELSPQSEKNDAESTKVAVRHEVGVKPPTTIQAPANYGK